MRSKLDPWEIGLLCELWEGVELRILDNPPRTQARLLKLVDDQLQGLRFKYKNTAEHHHRRPEQPMNLRKRFAVQEKSPNP